MTCNLRGNVVAGGGGGGGTCRFRNLDSSVPMMSPAKDRIRNNVSEPLDRTCAGRVLLERNMRSHLVIIDGIFRKDLAMVIRVERDQLIGALAPNRLDQAFSISVLPGRAERGGLVPDAHGSHRSLERAAKCSVIVTDEIFGRCVPKKCFGDLARQPLRRWVLGHRKPQQLPPSMAKNKKCE